MIENDLVLKIEQDLLKDRKIYISDEIGNYDASCFCATIDWLVTKSADPIHVHITSQGGAVLPMFGMYDALKLAQKAGVKITTVVFGYAASAAAVLLQAGDRRLATQHSRILLHEVSQVYFGQERASDAEESAQEMIKINNILLQMVADRCGRSFEELKTLTHKRDAWFDAEEALEFGLIDEIIR